MWPPKTLNAAGARGWTTMPRLFGEPSPQSIVAGEVAGRRAGVGVGEAADDVAEGERDAGVGGLAVTPGPAVSGASAMTANELPDDRDRVGAAVVGDRRPRPGRCPLQAA